jgi:hypothetical protein
MPTVSKTFQPATPGGVASLCRPASWVSVATITVLLCAGTAVHAAGTQEAQAQALYKSERAACLNGTSRQERSACLAEAGAALQAARQGRLNVADAEQRQKNALARCDLQAAQDRNDCIRRMQGEGTTSGNAADGGILRELVRPDPAPGAAR